jgi:hypothetical protein
VVCRAVGHHHAGRRHEIERSGQLDDHRSARDRALCKRAADARNHTLPSAQSGNAVADRKDDAGRLDARHER